MHVVCAIMSIWLVHIKEHVWTVGTCPTTILLSAVTMCECVYEWQQWRRLYQEDLRAAWGMRPVCSPGSWSGRGWLPLILAWHSQKWLALAANVKRSRKLMAKLIGRYIKILQLQLQLLRHLKTKIYITFNLNYLWILLKLTPVSCTYSEAHSAISDTYCARIGNPCITSCGR